MKQMNSSERKSDRELVTSRRIHGPTHLLFEAWTKPEIFRKWWVPKSLPVTLETCEMDARTGGRYRLVFRAGEQTVEFFGKYIDVELCRHIVWTNDENGEEAAIITTVTFEEKDRSTLVTVTDLYPNKEALDEALATGSCGVMPEQLAQLDQLMKKS